MYYKKEIGFEGETEACNYLEKIGYDIITRNFTCKSGEIDIIAYDKNEGEIVFVEVKSRNQVKFGEPAEAVNFLKSKHIRRTAEYYAYLNNIETHRLRFDVIEIFSVSYNKFHIHHIIQAIDYD